MRRLLIRSVVDRFEIVLHNNGVIFVLRCTSGIRAYVLNNGTSSGSLVEDEDVFASHMRLASSASRRFGPLPTLSFVHAWHCGVAFVKLSFRSL